MAQWSRIHLPMQETQETGLILGCKDPLEEEVAIYSSIPAWENPWTEEPGGLYSPWDQKELEAD